MALFIRDDLTNDESQICDIMVDSSASFWLWLQEKNLTIKTNHTL